MVLLLGLARRRRSDNPVPTCRRCEPAVQRPFPPRHRPRPMGRPAAARNASRGPVLRAGGRRGWWGGGRSIRCFAAAPSVNSRCPGRRRHRDDVRVRARSPGRAAPCRARATRRRDRPPTPAHPPAWFVGTPVRYAMEPRTRHILAGYAVALAATLAALGLRLALDPWLAGTTPFLMFAPAVMVSAWYGGTGPGVAATVAGAALGDYFLLKPVGFSHSLDHLLR